MYVDAIPISMWLSFMHHMNIINTFFFLNNVLSQVWCNKNIFCCIFDKGPLKVDALIKQEI